MTRPHTLEVATEVRDNHPATLLLVDEVDILEREKLVRRPDGSSRKRPYRYNPVDPVNLLPPESRLLLPTAHPTPVMIGVCTCWQPGCGSLWMLVRRENDTVIWEPSTDTPRGSIRHEYRFSLRPYLDALDDVAHPTPEDPARRLARELRTERDGLFGLPVHRRRVLDIWARPGSGVIGVTAVDSQAVKYHEISVGPTDTSADVVLALNNARSEEGLP